MTLLQGRDFHQHPPPQWWPLARTGEGRPSEWPDVATLESGTFTGHRARVLHFLVEASKRQWRFDVGKAKAPAGKVPGYLLREPYTGGDAGKRRLRELRAKYQVPVEHETFEAGDTVLYWIPRPWALAFAAGARVPAKPQEPREPYAPPAPPCSDLAGTRVSFVAIPTAASLGVHHVDGPGRCLESPPMVRDEDGYLEHLRRQHAEGELRRQLAGCQVEVAVSPAALTWLGFDPRPPLRTALEALGAQVDG
ncbi:MAG: hypothetical protein AAGN66_07015 [Acidobacteriota bacterium]